MLKEDLVKKNPLRVLNPGAEKLSDDQRMGVVLARAGIGKTAILVQIALDSLLRGNQVLHVSIGQNLEKTNTWYKDLFNDIAQAHQLENAQEIKEEIMRNRMIMTFNESSFSVPKLEERLNDLVAQNVFAPQCIVIDGFDFESADPGMIREMRDFVYNKQLQAWFTGRTHREDERKSAAGIPAPLHEMDDLFDIIILLKAESKRENLVLDVLKDASGKAGSGEKLDLDPATMLLKNV